MKYVVPLFVGAFVVAGFAYYTLFTGPSIDTPVSEDSVVDVSVEPQPAEETERETISGAGTIYSLVTQGRALECSITYIPNPVEPEITGTFFTDSGDLRGDFIVPTPDLSGQMVSSIIMANETIWQWTDIDGELVGSRQAAAVDDATLARLVAPVGLNTEVQYDCLTWPLVDRTIFTPPSTVLFTDATDATGEFGTIYPEEGEF